MGDSLYLAWRYLRYHKIKTAILVTSLTLIAFLPLGLHILVNESAEQLRARAAATPLIVGSKGSPLELVLNSLYFESDRPQTTSMAETSRVERSGLATVVPIYTGFTTRGFPIVGTTLDYFTFRSLKVDRGRQLVMLGECVVGNEVARKLELKIGSTLTSAPVNPFDLAGSYPLRMSVVGILAASSTADDRAVFVDIKTTWVIAGLGHGHTDVTEPAAAGLVLDRNESNVTANAAVRQYQQITAANRASFHFHGEPAQFPVTAVFVLPDSEKSSTLLRGRYQAADRSVQMVRPADVMDQLLATILKIRSFMVAGAALVGLATLLTAGLVIMLSLRLRKAEMATLARLGCSRFKIASMLACENLLVVILTAAITATLTAATLRFGADAIRWFLL